MRDLDGIRCTGRQTVDGNGGLDVRHHQRRPCGGCCAADAYGSITQFVRFGFTNWLSRSQQLTGRPLVDVQDRGLAQRLRWSARAGSRLQATGQELCVVPRYVALMQEQSSLS